MMLKWKKSDPNNEGLNRVVVGYDGRDHRENFRARPSSHHELFKPSCPCLKKPIKLKREAHLCFISSIMNRVPVFINYRDRAHMRQAPLITRTSPIPKRSVKMCFGRPGRKISNRRGWSGFSSDPVILPIPAWSAARPLFPMLFVSFRTYSRIRAGAGPSRFTAFRACIH